MPDPIERKYVIASNEHNTFPDGALLFWGRRTPDDSPSRSFGGYTTNLDKCELYTRDELREEFKGNPHYRFFDELQIADYNDFRQHKEVLCTREELESIGFRYWPCMVRL